MSNRQSRAGSGWGVRRSRTQRSGCGAGGDAGDADLAREHGAEGCRRAQAGAAAVCGSPPCCGTAAAAADGSPALLPHAWPPLPQALDRWEERLEALFEGRPYDSLDAALTDTISRCVAADRGWSVDGRGCFRPPAHAFSPSARSAPKQVGAYRRGGSAAAVGLPMPDT